MILTRTLQSTPFQNGGRVALVWTENFISNMSLLHFIKVAKSLLEDIENTNPKGSLTVLQNIGVGLSK